MFLIRNPLVSVVARSPAALGLPGVKADGKVSIDAGPPMEFPAPFGREMSKEETYIAEMDAKTGASLKLTILNPNGRIWTLVAGGGASVVYADVSLPFFHDVVPPTSLPPVPFLPEV